MAKLAARDGIAFEGAAIELEKSMTESPRRIARLTGTVRLPAGLDGKQREKLMAAVKACPVSRSLLPEIELDIKAL